MQVQRSIMDPSIHMTVYPIKSHLTFSTFSKLDFVQQSQNDLQSSLCSCFTDRCVQGYWSLTRNTLLEQLHNTEGQRHGNQGSQEGSIKGEREGGNYCTNWEYNNHSNFIHQPHGYSALGLGSKWLIGVWNSILISCGWKDVDIGGFWELPWSLGILEVCWILKRSSVTS